MLGGRLGIGAGWSPHSHPQASGVSVYLYVLLNEVDRGLADDGHHDQWAPGQGRAAPGRPMGTHENTTFRWFPFQPPIDFRNSIKST